MSAPSQKRRAERIQPFVASCRYVLEGGQRVPAFMTDLSTHGARVHTDNQPPAQAAAIVVEVRLGKSPTHQRLPATVVWSRPSSRGGFVFGVSFEGAGGAERAVLESVVEEFRRRAAALE
ncbi:MAG TPA: PilZ domain-containing protein [Vicinamibacteria bacterium]|nr:PilZ domain-containing protein [Vicinamibacteria bacterium]